MDLSARRPSVRRERGVRGEVRLLPRPARRTPTAASGWLAGHSPGRCLCRVQRSLRCRASARPDHRRGNAGCRAHARRNFLALAKVAQAPLAVEHDINGLPQEQQLTVRRHAVAPLLADLETWMRAVRAQMSRHAELAKAPASPARQSSIASGRNIGRGGTTLSIVAARLKGRRLPRSIPGIE